MQVWDLPAAVERGVLVVIKDGMKKVLTLKYAPYMREDEDMLNVNLWRDKSRKDWCKFDLEPDLFKNLAMQNNLYHDASWYPEGIPVVFISMHNTKAFESTDWLLSVIAKCEMERPQLSCTGRREHRPYCKDGSPEELKLRRQPTKYAPNLCCCIEPRQETKIHWGGRWFARPEDVPKTLRKGGKERTCYFP